MNIIAWFNNFPSKSVTKEYYCSAFQFFNRILNSSMNFFLSYWTGRVIKIVVKSYSNILLLMSCFITWWWRGKLSAISKIFLIIFYSATVLLDPSFWMVMKRKLRSGIKAEKIFSGIYMPYISCPIFISFKIILVWAMTYSS